MEIELLQFSECVLSSETNDPSVLFMFTGKYCEGKVFRRYDFESALQRMSVVCQLKN